MSQHSSPAARGALAPHRGHSPRRPGSASPMLNRLDDPRKSQSPEAAQKNFMSVYSEREQDFGILDASPETRNTRHPRICFDLLEHPGGMGGSSPSDEQLREVFNFFDVDGNGYIDLKEFKAVFRDCFETYGAPMEDKDVERIFEKFDRSSITGKAHDGKLQFDEFALLVLSRLKL